jgi:hypothetical protein
MECNKMSALFCLFLLMLMPADALWAQDARFVPVEGATLQAKQEAATRQAAASRQTRFWTAYSFDVRPGVAVDFEYVSNDGSRITINEGIYNLGGEFVGDWSSDNASTRFETRDLAVFLLHEAGAVGRIVRAEVYNLQRQRDYSSHPVYWLGRASGDESLAYLRGVADAAGTSDIASGATRAVSLHDHRRVSEVLVEIARTSVHEGARAQAVRSLGHHAPSPASRSFLTSIARDETASTELRRSAITAYGRARDAAALDFLTQLYDTVTPRDLRRTILSAAASNENRSGAACSA